MQIEFILLAVLFNLMRKHLQTTKLLPDWNNWMIAGLTLSIAMIFVDLTKGSIRHITVWIAHALLFTVVILLLKRSEFQKIRYVVFIVLPLIIINFIHDFVKLISPNFADRFKNYFGVASLLAIVWLIAMAISNNKQRKTLEKERLKAAEREKEFHITEVLKAQLEVQVAERTAALTAQKEELEKTLHELKATQSQLIQSEKMASLGELTAGIAHEIQNPLNFVNNFAEVNADIIEDIKHELTSGNAAEVISLANSLKDNNEKIAHHGKRADSIVKGMLQHSRKSTGVKEPTDINALVDECLRLSFHGLRAKDKSFNATFKSNLDPSLGNINIVPQDVGRVLLNVFNNSFYAVTDKKQQLGNGYEPTVTVTTTRQPGSILIAIRDNGNGIPATVLDKIFQPFFTTKPAGKGTGLGLSMSYEIITKGHGGKITIDTKEGDHTCFLIELPTG